MGEGRRKEKEMLEEAGGEEKGEEGGWVGRRRWRRRKKKGKTKGRRKHTSAPVVPVCDVTGLSERENRTFKAKVVLT